jgi:arylsulfatase
MNNSFRRLATIAFLTVLIGCAGAPEQEAPRRRPNVLVILADDLGFSDIGCYGGEISTPTLDRLAAGGLRFTQFYNTARCWPTRSCLLSGYYPQQIRMDPPKGRLPQWARLLPHELAPAGYRSYHSGKWHVNGAPKPVADGGFSRSYDMNDQNRYFSPRNNLEDDRPLPPVERGSGYYATTAIADHAIRCLKEHAREHPSEPFFSYLAFISPHFPLHALKEDIDLYRDKFLEGWDVIRERRWKRLRESGLVDCELSARDPKFHPRYFKKEYLEKLGPGEVDGSPAWTDLTAEQKRFQATKMAIHAAMVHRMDREIARVLDQVRSMNALDDTVVMFLSDNGADATIMVRGDGHDPAADPGSASSFLCLGPGWASASNSPFRRHKVWVHEGGISTPLIVHWPRGIRARGEFRRTQGHVVDLLPTILELGGATPLSTGGPRRPGRSLVPAFERDQPVPHEFIYFNHEGNHALRMGDWKLVSYQENKDAWELYDLSRDRAEMNDLASRDPERVKQMEARWKALTEEYARDAAGP